MMNIKIQRVSFRTSILLRKEKNRYFTISFKEFSLIFIIQEQITICQFYIGYIDDKIVSYRSVFQDSFENNEGKKFQSFGSVVRGHIQI